MRHFKLFTLFFLFSLLITHSTKAAVYSYFPTDSDSIKKVKADSLHKADSIKKAKAKKAPLESKVDYHARDSIRLDAKKRKVYLYGDADVKYENLELKAAYIDISMDSNIAHAVGVKDSNKIIGKPEFHQGTEVFHANEMWYNFKSKKGRINQITTKEGEGYILGDRVKKDSNNVMYMKTGRYTTCSEEPDPHFFIAATKLKVIPNDQVVTGPAMLVIENVPTPLVIPFGFFPLTSGRHSGIIMPQYGESSSQGFYLLDGGYYFGINDHIDMQAKGDIYTNGSWGLRDIIDYSNRYHYSGEFKFGYSDTRFQLPESAGFSSSPNFIINWTSTQDPKARPNSTFSASVNAGTSNYNSVNSYNPAVFLNNTMQSNIAFTQNFPQTPFHLTLNASHEQNTQTELINVTLPQLTFSCDRVYPAKWFESGPVNNQWYSFLNNISFSVATSAENTISAYQNNFFSQTTFNHMQNGVNSTIPISANFQVFRYFTLAPNFTITHLDYFQSVRQNWKDDTLKTDTVQGYQGATTFNFSVALSFNLYAMYSVGKKKAIQIRQVFYPSITFTSHPNYGDASYGYWRNTSNTPIGLEPGYYSIFQAGIFGGPAAGPYSAVGFNLATNLEMKIRMNTDSGIVYKKIKLLERFSIGSAYNMLAPTMNWAPISLAGNTTLFKKLAFNFSGNLDPYKEDSYGNDINAWDFYPWDASFSLGRLTSGELSLSTTLTGSNKNNTQQNGQTQQGNAAVNTGGQSNSSSNTGLQLASPNDYFEYEQMHPVYWAPIEIAPWSLTMFYNMLYSVNHFSAGEGEGVNKTTTQTIMFNGSMQLSKFWYVAVNSGYDITNNQFITTSFSARRDMHCWQLDFNTIPFGFHQSFTLAVHVKASVLQDLKLQRTRSWTDTQQYQ